MTCGSSFATRAEILGGSVKPCQGFAAKLVMTEVGVSGTSRGEDL
jgi:hypothetical protein